MAERVRDLDNIKAPTPKLCDYCRRPLRNGARRCRACEPEVIYGEGPRPRTSLGDVLKAALRAKKEG